MDDNRLELRPEISTLNVMAQMTVEEVFQNTTLRPILKLQNELLLRLISFSFNASKVEFTQMTPAKQDGAIVTLIQGDQALRNKIIGIVIGQFTLEEFDTYSLSTSHFNKRIHMMVIERIKSQKQEIEKQLSKN